MKRLIPSLLHIAAHCGLEAEDLARGRQHIFRLTNVMCAMALSIGGSFL